MIKAVKNTAVILLTAAAVYYCIVYPENIGRAVKESVDRCLCVILPSMFIFLCITTFISQSGIHSLLGRPLRIISEKLLRLPVEGIAVFLLSMISGYPAGAKLVSENFSCGILTARQAAAMNCFCCCAGPAFITGTAASFLYPDSNAGLLLFVCLAAGNIFTAAVMSKTLAAITDRTDSKPHINTGCIISSVKSASSAMLQMCIMIAAFGGLCEILRLSGFIDALSYYTSGIFSLPQSTAESIILTLLEISNIITLPPMQPELFPAAAFLLSFGGICVHMQIAAIAQQNFSIRIFLAARIFSASISAAAAVFFMRFLNADISCGATYKPISESSCSPLPSILLLIMIAMLLSVFKDKKMKS
ncbi:MAG: hypothetical protein E7508_01095 [Ruminococcus sp.]|nr:hypothetical protein [Ruminococcus sp.]